MNRYLKSDGGTQITLRGGFVNLVKTKDFGAGKAEHKSEKNFLHDGMYVSACGSQMCCEILNCNFVISKIINLLTRSSWVNKISLTVCRGKEIAIVVLVLLLIVDVCLVDKYCNCGWEIEKMFHTKSDKHK